MKHALGIIGCGLLGGSVALAARRRGLVSHVLGYSRREPTRAAALELGVIDRAVESAEAISRECDLLVLAEPVDVIVRTLELIGPHVRAGARVCDVGSVKGEICRAGTRHVGPGFVGVHPMAGSHRTGVAEAREDLFEGAACVITPDAQTSPAAADEVESFWRSLGARTIRTTPHDHDARVARVSHLPHLVAAALVNVQTDASLEVAGAGYRDTTRVAAGDAALWRAIALANAPAVLDSLDAAIDQLREMRQSIDRRDAEAIEQILTRAAERRTGAG